MGELMRLLNAPCRDIAALVSARMDTELSSAQHWAVRLHLLYCGSCRAYRRHIHLLRHLFRLIAAGSDSLQAETPSGPVAGPVSIPVLSAEARQRIQRAIDNSRRPDEPS